MSDVKRHRLMSDDSVSGPDGDATFVQKSNGNHMKNGHLSIDGDDDIQDGFSSPESVDVPVQVTPKIYKRRWAMLFVFVFYSMSNAIQWIHLNIIADVMMFYYNESIPGETEFQKQVAIDWLSMVYMLAYIPLIFPATWLLDKKGLRVVGILGTFLNCLGAWLKCAAVSPDRFGVLLFAQTICAIAQIFILGIPARLAAVWFGPNEVSTATAIGVFGNQVGVALGFLIPPNMIPFSRDYDEVGHNMSIMFYATAGVTTALFILVLCVFKKSPPVPPSLAQVAAVQAAANEDYGASLKRLLKNRGFLLLTLTYGVNTGSYYAIGTLLNPIILKYYEGQQLLVGYIGLTLVLAGVLGSVVAGIWLDKTKTFRLTTILIYALSMVGMAVFSGTLHLGQIVVVFVVVGALGFFMTGYLPVGFEFAAEITYPESEGTSSGLLNASAQCFGIIFTLGMSSLVLNVSVLSANLSITGALLIGTILTALIKSDLRRQKAGQEGCSHVIIEASLPEPKQDQNYELTHS
ncbi:heme transporter FLVCR2-like isoform X2 [Lineus longissimus]|uniref:heme transporter FLVCR2-like isoform X2 n=1 Tax=Lineus longissimus TaxID=88925 RepID=UPI002B4ED79D